MLLPFRPPGAPIPSKFEPFPPKTRITGTEGPQEAPEKSAFWPAAGLDSRPTPFYGNQLAERRKLNYFQRFNGKVLVNVTVENLAPCKKMLRVDVEAEKVDKTFEDVTRGFMREASFPGFRPGKAPREMVERKYGNEIRDEVKRKLISDSYKQAIDEQESRRARLPRHRGSPVRARQTPPVHRQGRDPAGI